MADPNQYFFDMNPVEEKGKQKKTKRPKMEFDTSKCWFCLASPSVEKHLIIAVGNTTYLALAKGISYILIQTFFIPRNDF